MNRQSQLDSTLDSILNEDKGVTTSYEREKNKDEQAMYEILSRMNTQKLAKTKQLVEKFEEKLQGKKLRESDSENEQELKEDGSQSIYNSLDDQELKEDRSQSIHNSLDDLL
jgi:uncharacterized membrane protein YheB (UPF0754 family)